MNNNTSSRDELLHQPNNFPEIPTDKPETNPSIRQNPSNLINKTARQ